MSKQLIKFLLVEDNEDHAELVRLTLQNERISNELIHFMDGESCWSYLSHQLEESEIHLPDVLLIDINLPGLSGIELLRRIKNHPGLKQLPVIVLTTSDAESDRERAYEEHVNSYLVKPLDYTKFQKMVTDLGLYWGIWNKHPYE